MQNKLFKIFVPAIFALSVVACDQPSSEVEDSKPTEATTQSENNNAAASSVKLETEQQRAAYALALQVGEQLKAQFDNEEMPIDYATFKSGLNDVLDGKAPALNEEEVANELNAFRERMTSAAQERMQQAAEENAAFLETNKDKEGVTVTDSGLQYEVLEAGDASGSTPAIDDVVKVNYIGKLIDGTEFDSSYARNQPAEFPLQGVIPGWTEALQLMRPGDKWRVTIPAELAYGEAGAGAVIPPNSTLIFDIELLAIVDSEQSGDAEEATQ